MWYEFKDERGRIESGTEIETVVLSDRLQYIANKGFKKRPSAQVAKLVDARDLNILSTQSGNYWCEWCQIRGNLSGNADGNPERSLKKFRNV